MRIVASEFILYVADQSRSTRFYAALLGVEPTLDVLGMTEFTLSPTCKLGLMSETSIARIVSGPLPHPASASGVPRCEVYLMVEDIDLACDRAELAGAVLVNPLSDRDWGHRVVYYVDPDGHVIALAVEVGPS
jgi:predicted enzyme related to lactoylglutathione lyase